MVLVCDMYLYGLLVRRKISIIVNIVNLFITFFGVVYRFYDFDNFQIDASLVFTFVSFVMGQILFVLCYQAILSIEDKEKRKISEKHKETNMIKMIYKEFH